MISLSGTLVARLDLLGAVKDEAEWTPDLIPSNLANNYASDNPDTVAELFEELARVPLSVSSAESITASKWRFGRRPIALLPLFERVLYRAVVNHLSPDLLKVDRGGEKYTNFEKGPLSDTKATHVVITDISNFYSSIPTELLADELTARTGAWEPVQWLRHFWNMVGNGRSGIPQVSQPSDIVAEVFADELHRRLLRRGLSVWRYADDFRIGAHSKTDAVAALETFDEEAGKLGLFVNERKTYIPDRGRYEDQLRSNSEQLSGFLKETEESLTGFDIYTFETSPPENSDVLQEASHRLIDFWYEERVTSGQDEQPVQQQVQTAALLRTSLNVLSSLKDSYATSYSSFIAEYEPQLTPALTRYLISVSGDDMPAAVKGATNILQKVPLYRWQRYWLLHFFSDNAATPGEYERWITEWVRGNLDDHSEAVRAQALWALARNWNMTRTDWEKASRLETRLSSTTTAAALHALPWGEEKFAATALSGDKLDRLVHKWAGEKQFIVFPF